MKQTVLTRAELTTRYRNEFTAGHLLYLRFGDTVIKVLANRQELIDGLTDYYRQFISGPDQAHITVTLHEAPQIDLPVSYAIKQPDPGKSKIKEEYVDLADGRIVRKRLTGMVFIFGKGDNMAIGPCLDNLNQVVNFINNRDIEKLLCDGCLLGHAAGVLMDGYGLALAGFSGAGKSTLALHLMSEGAAFVSNDRLMVKGQDEGLIMQGVAKLPRINPGTALSNSNLTAVIPPSDRSQFENLPVDELWDLEHKYDVSIDECYGKGRFTLRAPMHALVILNWQRNDEPMTATRIHPLERQDLLPSFIKSTGLFFTPDGDCQAPVPSLQAYTDILSLCRVYEFSGGADFKAATQACLALKDMKN